MTVLFRVLIAVAVFLSAAVWLFNTIFVVSGTGRYDLTVEVSLDGVRYAGSTVWELSVRATPGFVPLTIAEFDARGEAIDIALGDGRTLFILRRGWSSPPNGAYGSRYLACLKGDDFRSHVAMLATFRGSCDIAISPMAVVAKKDGSLEQVGPGTGRFTVISTIATGTDKRVTRGIMGRHPWIAQLPREADFNDRIPFYLEDFSR